MAAEQKLAHLLEQEELEADFLHHPVLRDVVALVVGLEYFLNKPLVLAAVLDSLLHRVLVAALGPDWPCVILLQAVEVVEEVMELEHLNNFVVLVAVAAALEVVLLKGGFLDQHCRFLEVIVEGSPLFEVALLVLADLDHFPLFEVALLVVLVMVN